MAKLERHLALNEEMRRFEPYSDSQESIIGYNDSWGDYNMLETLIAILIILWIVGLLAHIAGGLIHLLLVVALVVFIIRMLQNRKSKNVV
jgi:preprotein translocase subunit SecG